MVLSEKLVRASHLMNGLRRLAGATADALEEISAEKANQNEFDAFKNLTLSRMTAEGLCVTRTASGNPVTFADGYAANVKALSVTITPTQSGSGDPSPDNVRPVSGASSVTVTRTDENGENPQAVSVTLTAGSDPLTVYGGTLNVTTGTLTVTHGRVTLDGSRTWTIGMPNANSPHNRFFLSDSPFSPAAVLPSANTGLIPAVASHFPISSQHLLYYGRTGLAVTPVGGVIIAHSAFDGYADASDFTAWLAENPVEIVYKLATPVTYQLAPQQLATLSGYNAVSADAGTLSVTYRTDPAITELGQDDYLEPAIGICRATLPATGWNRDGSSAYPYYYDLAAAGVTAADIASVTVSPSGIGAAVACGLCPTNETRADAIRFRSYEAPTAVIAVEYEIAKGSE